MIDSMALYTLLTGLQAKIGYILCVSDPDTIITAISRIRRKLQLHQNEKQNLSSGRTETHPIRKASSALFVEHCPFCQRNGYIQEPVLN